MSGAYCLCTASPFYFLYYCFIELVLAPPSTSPPVPCPFPRRRGWWRGLFCSLLRVRRSIFCILRRRSRRCRLCSGCRGFFYFCLNYHISHAGTYQFLASMGSRSFAMHITFPGPISTFNSAIPPKRSGVSSGVRTEKFFIALLPGDADFFISMGNIVPFW